MTAPFKIDLYFDFQPLQYDFVKIFVLFVYLEGVQNTQSKFLAPLELSVHRWSGQQPDN